MVAPFLEAERGERRLVHGRGAAVVNGPAEDAGQRHVVGELPPFAARALPYRLASLRNCA